jgi:hypothetical protein
MPQKDSNDSFSARRFVSCAGETESRDVRDGGAACFMLAKQFICFASHFKTMVAPSVSKRLFDVAFDTVLGSTRGLTFL